MLTPSFFHWYVKPVPVLAFRTTLLPEQKVVDPAAVITEDGKALTVTAIEFDVPVKQFWVELTVYVPDWITSNVFEAAPVIAVPFRYHWLPEADEVRVTLPPWQKVVLPELDITGVEELRLALTVIVRVFAVQEELLVIMQ